MLVFILQILTLSFLLIGMIVCKKGMKSGNVVYKGGFYFFLFSFLSNLCSFVLGHSMNTIIQRLTDRGAQDIGVWVYRLSIPSSVLNVIGLIIFIVCLLAGSS
mgnify:FL=1